MNIIETELKDCYIIEPNVFGDNRGYFTETYNKKTLEEHGIFIDFIQDNQSLSELKGTLRGLHLQTEPMAQTKLVRCLSGSVYDVAADLRPDSPTYLLWIGVN